MKKRKLIGLIVLALAMALFSSCGTLSSKKEVDTTIAEWLRKAPLSVSDRVPFFSEKLLNKPYKFRSFGEGPQGDVQTAPLYHLDTFDCVNFIEIVVAMVCSTEISDFKSNIIGIRYLSPDISFIQRAHFSETDWILNSIKKGFLKDSTKSLFPKDFKELTGAINKKEWLKKLNLDFLRPHAADTISLKKKLLQLSDKEFSYPFSLPYVPKDKLLQRPDVLKNIPNGAVVHFLYLPKTELVKYFGTDYFVQHAGVVIKKEDGVFLRSASSEMESRFVNDRELLQYLKNIAQDENFLGINILDYSCAK